jgi:hypothetical protein
MTDEQFIAAVTRYAERLKLQGCEPLQGDTFSLNHIAWMCYESAKHLETGKRDKAMRWLGFIQGVLWNSGLYDLQSLKNDNR